MSWTTRAMTAIATAALAALGLLTGPAGVFATRTAPIRHVFIIVLENENADVTFGQDSPAPYLAKRLPARGAFVPNYYGTGHLSLDDYIAMVSGQGPNVITQADCPFYLDLIPGLDTGEFGQVIGQGCVYPSGTITIANQLEDSGFTWKGYMQDMNNGAPPGTETPCRHPELNGQDHTQSAEAGDQYATRHNPFVYFHSIIDFPTCAENDVDLSHLRSDLHSKRTTPNYAFITPDLCNDGHDEPCVNGDPGGLEQANAFLRQRVPKIIKSPGFRDNGLLLITFDEAESGDDASACCNEKPGPNTPNPGALTVGPGGGRVGAVMLSPCINPGTVSETPYNHYSQLRSIEDFFGLPHLGFAQQPGLASFGRDIFGKLRDRSSALGRCRPSKPAIPH